MPDQLNQLARVLVAEILRCLGVRSSAKDVEVAIYNAEAHIKDWLATQKDED